jgi:hypothetical protein
MAIADDLKVLMSSSSTETAKLEALDRVETSDDPHVLEVLLAAGGNPSLSQEVGKAVGAAIAQIFWRQERVLDAPLHLFTGPVGASFDETIAVFQRLTARDPKSPA